MLQRILDLDTALFSWLNGLHQPWLDSFMIFATKTNSWIPLYLLIIGLIFYKSGLRKGSIQLLIIILSVGLADFITSGLMKPFFERLRPCHDPFFQGNIFVPFKCGGKYGFASSHAGNTFALATILSLFFSKEWGQWIKIMLVWAAVVSYSRVYVGVHYPLDILVGALIGIVGAILMFNIFKKLSPKVNQSLRHKKMAQN
jgi:undecaprenyl-diphosphatase